MKLKNWKVALTGLLALSLTVVSACSSGSKEITLKYGHTNTPESIAGKQADLFAELVEKKTEGRVKIEVYPSGQLGNLAELSEGVKLGTIDMVHNTMAAIGSIYDPISALDTPYLYKDPQHMYKVTDSESPVIKKLNEGFIKETGVRMLYTFYLGTRHLTSNNEAKNPSDMSGQKIRALPFPMYIGAVEGMGAQAIPVEFSELPTALATGVVNGQENPLDIVVSQKFYDMQKYLMLTGHIIGANGVIINDKVWNKISENDRAKILEAAKETRDTAMQWNLDIESQALVTLKEKGMTIIGPEQGLDNEAFKQSIQKEIVKQVGNKYDDIYAEVAKAE